MKWSGLVEDKGENTGKKINQRGKYLQPIISLNSTTRSKKQP
jgi:hypothetical protein